MKTVTYNYEWKTPEEIYENRNKKCFPWGPKTASLREIIGEELTLENIQKANEIWAKLKEAFNAEAPTYNPKYSMSRLGSIGEITRREVMRPAWWSLLNGDDYGDYDTLTFIIEILHDGEALESGEIIFGS